MGLPEEVRTWGPVAVLACLTSVFYDERLNWPSKSMDHFYPFFTGKKTKHLEAGCWSFSWKSHRWWSSPQNFMHLVWDFLVCPSFQAQLFDFLNLGLPSFTSLANRHTFFCCVNSVPPSTAGKQTNRKRSVGESHITFSGKDSTNIWVILVG